MRRAIYAIAGVLVIALIVWISRNVYWADVKVPTPLKGEALTNPFYAAQRLTIELGGRTSWDRSWPSPSNEAIVVLSGWHWDLLKNRREAIERWVERGGRLLVDRSLAGELASFERWSGIVRTYDAERLNELQKRSEENELDPSDEADYGARWCDRFIEERHGVSSAASREICSFEDYQVLSSNRGIEWALRGTRGVQAMRVRVGRGSVTAINGTPFRSRAVLEADHGWLLIAATQFRRGDEIRFLSEDEYPSLLALLWQNAGPAVVLMLVIVALLLWRGWVRFGPMTPPLPSARRSLAEQIRGSGEFALRHGSGDSLHAAVVRALTEAVSRRVPGYLRLPPQEQTAALARLAGMDSGSLAAALHHLAARRAERLRNALALLETARRRALTQHPRSSDGTD